LHFPSPVGRDIQTVSIEPDERRRHIDVGTVNQVDIDWLVDSALSEDDAVRFIFQTVLRREPSEEETAQIQNYFESSTEDRRERLDALNWVLHSWREATTVGIYEFRGNQLTVCLAPPGKERPKKFGIGKDGGQIVITFKRVADDEAPTSK